MNPIPQVMSGVICTGYCFKNPEQNLQESNNIKVPSHLKDNEVLVEMKFAALNPADYKVLQGIVKLVMKTEFPSGVGKDGSGVVVSVGKSVKRFKVGDEVFGCKDSTMGTFAQYAKFKECELTLKPSSIPFEKVSFVSLAGSTALQCFDHAVKSKKKDKMLERVLIIGASGGVGSFVTLIAKHYLKAKNVYAVCSTDNVEYVQSLGADRVIDYKTEDIVKVMLEECKDNKSGPAVTYMVDCVRGFKVLDECSSLVDPSSVFVTIVAPEYVETNPSLSSFLKFGTSILWRKTKTTLTNSTPFVFLSSSVNGERLQPLINWIETDKEGNESFNNIRTQKMNLKDVKEAFKKQYSKRTVGKIIFEIDYNSSKEDEQQTETTSSSTIKQPITTTSIIDEL